MHVRKYIKQEAETDVQGLLEERKAELVGNIDNLVQYAVGEVNFIVRGELLLPVLAVELALCRVGIIEEATQQYVNRLTWR